MKYILLNILLLFIFLKAKAQESGIGKLYTFSLKECIDYALENRDSVKNAKLDILSASYKVKETIGIGLPQIDGSAQLQDFLKLPTSLLPGEFFGQPGTFIPVTFGVKYQSTVGINATQLIFNGSYIVGLRASKTYKELSERNLSRTKIATQVAVTKAYYQVLVNAEQIKLLEANVNQLKKQLDETTELNKQGFVEKIDLDRLKVLYNNLSTTKENTIRLLALGYQMLKFQMGMPVTDHLVLSDKIENIKLNTFTSPSIDTAAYRNRIEFKLVSTQKKLNELNYQRARSNYLPSLAAFGSTSYQFQSNSFSNLYNQRFPTTVVGLQLNIPIFSGLQRLNQVRQSKIEVLKTDNMLYSLKNAITMEQEFTKTSYQNAMQSLNNQRDNMTLAKEVLRVSKLKYEQGVGSSLEVTQAQTALQEAENNYIQALYDALISKVDLDKAYGQLQ